MNRTLLDKVRAMIKKAGMLKQYWGETIIHAANLHNRTASSTLKMRTPHGALLRKKPDNSYLRIFGCAAYTHLHKEIRHGKMGDRTVAGIYIGTQNEL